MAATSGVTRLRHHNFRLRPCTLGSLLVILLMPVCCKSQVIGMSACLGEADCAPHVCSCPSCSLCGAAEHTCMAERSINLYPESELLCKIQRCRFQARTLCSYADDALIEFTCSCHTIRLRSRLFHKAHNTEHALRVGTKCAARQPFVRCAVARRLQHNDIGAHWKRHPERSSRSV